LYAATYIKVARQGIIYYWFTSKEKHNRMVNMNAQLEYVKSKPILVGLFAVLAVVVIGAAVAFAAGFTIPTVANAEIVGPPCCTPPPPPPP
jgi:hypothetical protein